MKKWLLDLTEITTKRGGRAIIDAEDMEEAELQACDYFNQGPYHQGVKPTEIWFPPNQVYSVTEVSVRRDVSPPGPYIVEWADDKDTLTLMEGQTMNFDSFELAECFAVGLQAKTNSVGHIEHVEDLRYEGQGDWAWNPSIQMSWGEE